MKRLARLSLEAILSLLCVGIGFYCFGIRHWFIGCIAVAMGITIYIQLDRSVIK